MAYLDNFSDYANHNNYAYPTTVTDADNFPSTSQYNYDKDAVTRTQDPKGAVVTVSYDAAGRRDTVTNLFNNAYTHWAYDIDNGHTRTYSTVNSAPGDPLTAEAYTNTIVDGLGQVRLFVANHPGSTGGYRAVWTKYDAMGRVKQQSNMIEITGGGVPAGADDPAAPYYGTGWVWTGQTYDGKGRPLQTTKPDGSITEVSYDGCGCAGGEVTTVTDERGRRRKYTKDVLGRLWQVSELNWDTSVYADTTYYYNALDQLLNTNQAGQWRGWGYDGYGRLIAQDTPEQGHTAYSYNADDTMQTVPDARGDADLQL